LTCDQRVVERQKEQRLRPKNAIMNNHSQIELHPQSGQKRLGRHMAPEGQREVRDKSGEVEAVGVHHLVPGTDEVLDELLAGVVLGVGFCQRTQL